jgi:hypothetical protein
VRFESEGFDQRDIVDVQAIGASLGVRRRGGPAAAEKAAAEKPAVGKAAAEKTAAEKAAAGKAAAWKAAAGKAAVGKAAAAYSLRHAKSRDAKVRAGNEDAWEGWLAKLTRYKAEHGDCNVPWTKDPSAYPDALTLSRTDPLSVTDGLCRVGCASLSGGRQEMRPSIALSYSHALTLPCSRALTR